jgi:alpha-mannosidase
MKLSGKATAAAAVDDFVPPVGAPASSAPTLPVEEILLLHHSHLDVGYTHSQPIIWELQQEFITQAIGWLEQTRDLPEGSRPKWTCEATEPLRRWLDRASSVDVGRFKALHKQGRIGVTALRWHVDACIDRAGLQRLLDGKEELEQLLEAEVRVACQHDVNGVPWPLADILLDAGVDFFAMAINPHLGRAVQPRPGMFRWESPSGRHLRVFNGSAYTMFDQALFAWDNSTARMEQGWSLLERHLRTIGYSLPFVYLTSTCSPVLWDNSPPNPFLPGLVERWNETDRTPRIRYATLDDVRERALSVPDEVLPILRGDWTDYWSFGCGSAPTATALNRRAKSLLVAASGLNGDDQSDVLARATMCVDLYDEHTFGYWDTSDEHPQTQTIEVLKQALAHEGYELASFAVMDRLDQLAANPSVDGRIGGVLLCNPGSHPVSFQPELPAGWFDDADPANRTYKAQRTLHEGRSWESGFPGELPRSFGPVALKAFTWKAIPLDRLPPSMAAKDLSHRIRQSPKQRQTTKLSVVSGERRRVGTIESAHYTFSYDPDSGRILSLVDRDRASEILAPRNGIDFFAFVRERADALDNSSRLAFYQRDLDRERVDASCWHQWKPVHEGATRARRCTVRQTETKITFERELEAPGVRHLVQRISFFSADPVIQLDLELELEPNPAPQGIYFAFPLAMNPNWDAVFDTAGQTVRLDEDQLPGACRNWVTVDGLAAIGSDEGAIALLCPDAPLVQFGNFHFGPPLEAIPRPENPLLLAWLYNNYWETNFPRVHHGRIRVRYGLVSLPRLDTELAVEYAQMFRRPPLIWPVTATGRGQGQGPLLR